MRNLEEEIEQLETRAAEAEMVANLSADPAKKAYNRSLSEQLLAEAEILKQRLKKEAPASPCQSRG